MRPLYKTKRPRGCLPAGMTVEVISLVLAARPDSSARDYGLFGGDSFGNGQRILVRFPGGSLHGTCTDITGLHRLGIYIEDLEG